MVGRVPQQSMTRRYQNNMSSALKQMNSISNKILSQRKFMRGSEDPVRAAKALNIRNSMRNIEIYKTNLADAEGYFGTASDILLHNISPRVTNIADKLESGVNGEKGQTERDIIAEEIEAVGRDMMKDMNMDFADRRIFGGSNNSESAFEYNEKTGVVTYNGAPVNSKLEVNNTDPNNPIYTFNGKEVSAADAKKDNSQLFPGSKPVYIDIGAGIQYDENGAVDPTTALDMSVNGAKVTGSGIDPETGLANNVIQLAFDSAKALRAGDVELATKLMDQVRKAQTTVLVGNTNLGVKSSTIEYNKTRMAQDEITYATAQVSAEGLTLEEQAELMTEYKSVEAAYNAALQMGSKVIPTSVFDFIR